MTPLFPRPIIIPFSPIMPLLPKPIIIPLSASVTNRFIPLTGRGIRTFNNENYMRNVMKMMIMIMMNSPKTSHTTSTV